MEDSYEGASDIQYAKSTGAGMISALRNPPVRKIVEQRIADFQKQIEVHQKLLAKLDENKGVEEVLDILRKIGL